VEVVPVGVAVVAAVAVVGVRQGRRWRRAARVEVVDVAKMHEYSIAEDVLPPEVWREVAELEVVRWDGMHGLVLGNVQPHHLRDGPWVARPGRELVC
jgi:hypothetical protein